MENAASRFGQHLAHTEKKYRDRALKKLTVYLTKKKEWTDLEWDKLWKALFYCMWMSDKRPVQEELSTNLAALVHKVPESDLALEFVHSFFRTMHREWHGLDGLRLDKFYSLVRKFVRETVALLRVQDWDEDLVQKFVTVLSSEVVSQLPNGLRMHLADLYLTEIYTAAAKDLTTEAFVTLLEPFFTLLSGEYDKTVFKRVKELVFEGMLTNYKFGPQPEKEQEDEEETDDEEQEEDEDKVFEQVDVAQVQHRIFAIASADDTAERNRSALYTLYKKFFAVTHIDSFQAAQEEAANPVKKAKKQKKVEKKETAKVEEEAAEKKSKKRKAKKDAEVEVEAVVEEVEEVQSETPSKKKAKKQKVVTVAKDEDVEMKAPAESKKSKKQQKKQEEAKKVEEVEKKTEKVEKKTEKVEKKAEKVENKAVKVEKKTEKVEKKVVKMETKVETKTEKVEKKAKNEEKAVKKSPAKEEPKLKQEVEKKKDSYTTVTKSGKKFKRCGSCGGYGKGLVPKDKLLCGHCERSQKTQKKKSASASKKRKAESQAQAAREELEKAELGKKVTFGKSKALRHEVSVKRLRASAKRDAVSKESEEIKGVLKVKSPSPAASKKTKSSKGRKTASDFF